MAWHAVAVTKMSAAAAGYMAAMCGMKQLLEWRCLLRAAFSRRMRLDQKLTAFLCSHLLTPALSLLLSVLHLVFSQLMPAGACLALFWVRVLLLPPLAFVVSAACWVRHSALAPCGSHLGAAPFAF